VDDDEGAHGEHQSAKAKSGHVNQVTCKHSVHVGERKKASRVTAADCMAA
jgi:hypothetical protein